MLSIFDLMIGMGSKGFGLPAKTANTKVILNGGQRVTFVRPDGYFALYPIPLLNGCNLHLLLNA